MGEVSEHQHADAFRSGRLQVSDIHTLHYEQYGNPDGKPVIFLHGGPGGGTSKANTVFFDPSIFHVVLMDQRGAGKSTPCGDLQENTTQHLVQDIETLRKKLNIEKWHVVFGGSWGSTLALAYAQTHPNATGSLVLRGIMLGIDESAGFTFFPDEHEKLLNYLTPGERSDPFASYLRRVTTGTRSEQLEAGRMWNKYELVASTLALNDNSFAKLEDDDWVLAHARLETHYFGRNASFMEEGQLLKAENIDKIKHIPTSIVQGRYDIVCPPKAAWELHKALPQSKMYFVRDSGHSATDPGNLKKLIEICNAYGRDEF